MNTIQNSINITTIEEAAQRLTGVAKNTPLQLNKRLSEKYNAKIYLKREDLQEVRSYKIRGAYSLMSLLTPAEKKRGVVCASAGNHAQGVALSASLLRIKATIFMPSITPLQKIDRVKKFGKSFVTVKLIGQTYDECSTAAHQFCDQTHAIFVHPFDDARTISGQGTVGKEIFDVLGKKIDFVVFPIGGGGLMSGAGTYLRTKVPDIQLIGVEPAGAPAMHDSIAAKKVITLKSIDTFVDGAAVKTVGQKTFAIVSKITKRILLVTEGKVCTTMIELYQNEGIVAEPAGALSISALDEIKNKIAGKTVICILSGGNNDILRYPEIMEKSLIYQGLKHYFLIKFTQKPGQLRQFLNHVLGPHDDIVRIEYIKKTSKEYGPALFGIQLRNKKDLAPILKKMKDKEISYRMITSNDLLYSYLI